MISSGVRFERKTFPDGERYFRIVTETSGRDVVLLGGTPRDLDVLEIYDLGYAIFAQAHIPWPF